MSISKKALMIGIGSTIAVGGITTAIAVPLSQSQSAAVNRIPSTPLAQATTIQTLLDGIKQEDVVVLDKKQAPAVTSLVRKSLTETGETNKPIERNSVYAFDLENTQFALTQEAINKFKTFNDVSFSFEINNEANNSVELNKGNVGITLKATVNNNEVGKINLTLTEFKTINTNLAGVLKNDDQTHKAVLDLVNAEKDKTLKTVEQLNTKTPVSVNTRRGGRSVVLHDGSSPVLVSDKGVSGLSTLLHTVTANEKEDKDLKDWVVEGSVKLDRINTDNKTTFFHLVSSNESKLKLVKTGDKGAKEEALVDEIKVTNLLASNIKFVPSNVEEEEDQKAYLTKFETEATGKGFKGEKTKGFHLEVKKMSSGPDTVNVAVTPFNIDRKEEKQDLLVNLEISFGEKDNVKTYKTTETKDLEELKNGGFNLSIYSKNLKDKEEVVMANKILDTTDMNKLASYFIKDGLITPVKKTDIEMNDDGDSMPKVPVGGFSLVSTSTGTYNNGFNLGQVKTIMENNDHGKHKSLSDTKNVDWVTENWISFVGYTYNGLVKENEQGTLFIPTINLLHVQEPIAQTAPGVISGK